MDSVLATFFIFGTPAIAIIGGIVAGIVKTRGQHRIIEMAQRERIAAIERGLQLSELPPLPTGPSARQLGLVRAQGMFIGGLLTIALGVGLSFALRLMPEGMGREAWPIGFVPVFIGLALLLAGRVVRKGVEGPAFDA